MRLGFLLTISLLTLAVLVGVLGLLLDRTSEAVGAELDDLRRSSIDEVLGADGMERALLATQAAAYQLLAERYRWTSEVSHESGNEWVSVEGLDFDEVDHQLEEFEASLELSRRAVAAGASDLSGQQERLDEISSHFLVHRQLLARLIHLMRYHPNDHVREHLQDRLEPYHRDVMAPLIRDFASAARRDLVGATEAVEELLARAARRNRWIAGVAFVFALLVGLLLARAISTPLARLRDAALRIGAGELEHRVAVRSDNEIGVLAEAFNQMAKNLRASTVSRTFLDNILQSMREIVLVVDSTGVIQTANHVASEELGTDDGPLVGRPFSELVVGGAEAIAAGAGEVELQGARGTFPASYSRSDLRDPGSDAFGFVLVARDITERRAAEETLRRSLHDKEVLLKEVHHRVKNNLQIVSSLLSLQENDPDAKGRGLRESQNRIRSMALIHEHLYQSPNLADIDFRAYIEELVAYLLASYESERRGIQAEINVLACPLSLDTAIPCGMIVNELVANAVEHAFPDHGGRLRISYAADNGLHELRVADDGAGPPAGFDLEAPATLGLRLVTALTRQLGGDLTFQRHDGETEFCVRFAAAGVEA